MKVIYKKSIVEKIDEEIFKAKCDNKQIEEIILSKEEWEELYTILCVSLYAGYFLELYERIGFVYRGIVIKKEAVE